MERRPEGGRGPSASSTATRALGPTLTEAQRPALVDPPPNISKLTLQKFHEGVDDMTFLKTFKMAARAGRWLEEQWSLYREEK